MRRYVMKLLSFSLAVLLVSLGAGISDAAEGDRLVFSVHPYKSAIELEFMFAPHTGYLSSLVGKPVLLSISRDYDEHISRIAEGKADIAFMAPAVYVEMVERYGEMPLLARLETGRVPTYYGRIPNSPKRQTTSTISSTSNASSSPVTAALSCVVPRHFLNLLR